MAVQGKDLVQGKIIRVLNSSLMFLSIRETLQDNPLLHSIVLRALHCSPFSKTTESSPLLVFLI